MLLPQGHGQPDCVLGGTDQRDLLATAGIVSARAVTIAARPEDIWPWLVQLGSGRGGACTYDWIDNLLGRVNDPCCCAAGRGVS